MSHEPLTINNRFIHEWYSVLGIIQELRLISGINRLAHSINLLINDINRLIHSIDWLINGILWSTNGWGASLGPRATD